MGGGPSLNNVNFDLIKDRRIIAINNAYGDPVVDSQGVAKKDKLDRVSYTPRSWVDAVWFCDSRWFSWHCLNLREFPGIIAHCGVNLTRIGTNYFKRGKPEGLEERPEFVSWNSNAGFSGINFAYHLGVRRVVLLGYDMRRVDNQPNWHKDHPSPEKNPYFRFLRREHFVAKDAERLGLEIINCTPGSAAKKWPIMTLEEYLKQEEQEVREMTLDGKFQKGRIQHLHIWGDKEKIGNVNVIRACLKELVEAIGMTPHGDVEFHSYPTKELGCTATACVAVQHLHESYVVFDNWPEYEPAYANIVINSCKEFDITPAFRIVSFHFGAISIRDSSPDFYSPDCPSIMLEDTK